MHAAPLSLCLGALSCFLSFVLSKFSVKQALDLGHLSVAIPLRVNVFIDVVFSRERVYVQKWLKSHEYEINVMVY